MLYKVTMATGLANTKLWFLIRNTVRLDAFAPLVTTSSSIITSSCFMCSWYERHFIWYAHIGVGLIDFEITTKSLCISPEGCLSNVHQSLFILRSPQQHLRSTRCPFQLTKTSTWSIKPWKMCYKIDTNRILVYKLRVEALDRSPPRSASAGIMFIGYTYFLLLCACLQMTAKMLELEICFSE